MRAMRKLQHSWLLSTAVMVVGISILVSSLPELTDLTAAPEWRPEGVRITGRWQPVVSRAPSLALTSDRSESDSGFLPLAEDQSSDFGPPSSGSSPKSARSPLPKEVEQRVGIQKYRVADGDRYWTIAQRFLGRGDRWNEIQALNPEVSPNRLREGTIIRVPVVAGSPVKKYPRAAITRQGSSPPTHPQHVRPLEHRVRRGESLSEIASRYYTDGDWRRIFDANRDRVKHPNRVEKGTMLIIPRAPGKERRS